MISGHRIIPNYAIDLVSNKAIAGLGKGTSETNEQFRKIIDLTESILKLYPEPLPEYIPHVTKADLMPEGDHYDTAVPQAWLDDYIVTVKPKHLCICWDTKLNKPIGLTKVDRALIRAYLHIKSKE